MKPRVLLLLAALFFAGPVLRAQTDSLANVRITQLAQQVDTVSRQQAAASARMRFLDSATGAAIDTSFSQALNQAMRHPEQLYNQKKYGFLSLIAYALLAFFLFLSFYYLFTTALCRNESYADDCTLKDIHKRPFSYARVQLFWWTVIIISCYIWFYAAYNVLLPLNSSVVILLGSGLAVFIFGKAIDNSQIEKNNKHVPTRHQDINDSKGFLTDILSDDNGVSIHRMQAVAFNIIFGLGFIGYFFSSIATKNMYPFIEFEPWQFSLLGVSAIGYLGVKANENSPGTIGNRKAMKAKGSGSTPVSGNTNGNASGSADNPGASQPATIETPATRLTNFED